jgi:23S rRNA pseudouridine2605 synthase
MTEVRLQKFLAECGVGSRRKMEQFIIEGRVRINGQVVTKLGVKVDPDNDKVEVNRKPVHAAPKGIMLLHKPRGVVSTLSDPEGRPTVADYLTKHYRSYFPVGRLDWDSTGLMVMTNDGEIAERLMHPRFGFERVYHARVEGSVSEELLRKMEKGVRLSDGMVSARGSILRGDEKSTWIEIRIQEGRNRVVRRMFDKLEHPVMKLRRTVYGPFKLGKLQPGSVRVLTRKEYEEARRKVLRAAESGAEKTDRSLSRASTVESPDRKSRRSPGATRRDSRNERRGTGRSDERGGSQRGKTGRRGAGRGRSRQRSQ